MKRPGRYVPLHVNYDSDDKIVAAGEAAEVLYIRALAYCMRMDTEGFVPDYQLPRFGLSRVRKRAETLVEKSLWCEVTGGYEVTSWAKWNHSGDELAAKRRKQNERKNKERAGQSDLSRRDRGVTTADVTPLVTSMSRPIEVEVEVEIDKNNPPTPQRGGATVKPSKQSGSRLPESWKPSQEAIAWARSQGYRDDWSRIQTETFRDYWLAKPGAAGKKLDWDATWRNWLRRAGDNVSQPMRRTASTIEGW